MTTHPGAATAVGLVAGLALDGVLGDPRRGHPHGAIPLVCNANPLALLTEAAGGEATDAMQPILDLVPEGLRQRTALVFGAKREVGRIARYHAEPSHIAERAPLFGHRGLFRT